MLIQEGCLTLDCYERAWNATLKAPKRTPARPECNCYLHGDIGTTIVVVTSVAIVMPIRIKLQFVKIECYMIQILAYLLEHFQKTAIIKKVRKSWIVDTNYTQETLF